MTVKSRSNELNIALSNAQQLQILLSLAQRAAQYSVVKHPQQEMKISRKTFGLLYVVKMASLTGLVSTISTKTL